MGLMKPRTRLGHWIDARGIKQSWLEGKTGYSKNTLSALCNNPDYKPNLATMQNIIKALREISSVSASDFWDI